jgi:hypothetical protein
MAHPPPIANFSALAFSLRPPSIVPARLAVLLTACHIASTNI